MNRRYRVIVIGAGPTGLALALALGMAGVDVLVLEAEPGLTRDLRAGSYHPPTIEMLAGLGVAERMHDAGIVVPVWQVRDRVDGVIAEFDLSLLRDETPYPYRLHLEQHRLTPMLLDRLTATSSVTVRFGAEVTAVEQDAERVTVAVGDERLHADWLVGCDGARSVARRSQTIPFEGFTWPERLLVASTTYDLGRHGFADAGYIADPDDWAAVFRVPDDGPPGLWRIAYPTDHTVPEAEVLADDAIQPRLAKILEHVDTGVERYTLKYRRTYRVHQRVAETFRRGRVVLAGDAAHLNNPLGGFGLNGGIHDAVNLAEKLVGIVGGGDARLLDLYDRQRRPITVAFIQAMSIRNKRMIEQRDPAVRRRHQSELRATAADPAKARAYLMDSSMLSSVRDAAAVT